MSPETQSPSLTPEPTLVAPGSGAMFDAIAPRYDLLNRLISLGVDQSWRRKTVQGLALPARAHVLDLATGTADLAIQIARAHGDCQVVGVDPSKEMLAVGRDKISRQGLSDRIELMEGVAEALPFDDQVFSGVTMAFGIRNVGDRPRALSEISRVTRRGGRVCILELSEPHGALSLLTRFHMHRVVPLLGALLSGARAYRYLPESIAAFPAPEAFEELMRCSGLELVSSESLTFGVCHLYVGAVP